MKNQSEGVSEPYFILEGVQRPQALKSECVGQRSAGD